MFCSTAASGDTIGGSMSGDPDVRYSVFENMAATAKALVVVNFGDHAESATATLAGDDGRKVEIAAPFEQGPPGETLPLSLDYSAPSLRRGGSSS